MEATKEEAAAFHQLIRILEENELVTARVINIFILSLNDILNETEQLGIIRELCESYDLKYQ